ncbi:MAG: transposase [Yaniella sp.]|uniref:transposase n=1 Tax=Yaniella sp. TaxID=2773929 RepID=UPI0026569931|nr:transposase [Yaniella sp.]
MSTNSPRYTEEFKQQLVEDVLAGGKSKAGVAREYGVSVGSVKNWVKQYRVTHAHRQPHHFNEPKDIAPGTSPLRADTGGKSVRERELEHEVQELKDELAFVRKAAAYIARGLR